MAITRRSFFSGAALGTAGAALACLAGCVPAASASKDLSDTGETTVAEKYSWEMPPEPITDIVEAKDFDVVIIGAGVSGTSAAEAASREGAKVAVLEQSGSFTSLGMDCAHIGSKWQKEHGIEIDPDDASRLIYKWSQSTANRQLINTWATRSGEVFDYLIDIAEESGLVIANGLGATTKLDWGDNEETWRIYNTPISFVNPEDGMFGRTKEGNTANYNLVKLFVERATDKGAEFFYNTRALQLVQNGSGAITGVIAQSDGGYVQYNAAKGVILACGDFAGNKEMVDAWCPIMNRADAVVYPVENGNMGDGIKMGLWAGAALSRTEPAPMIHPVDEDFVLSPFYMAWMTVNVRGERYAPEMPYEPYITNARMVQPNNIGWNIFDADYATWVEKQWPEKYEYFLNEGSTYSPGKCADILAERVESGSIVSSDTLEGLAQSLGIPANTFVATVKRYNELCEEGKDVDFGVMARYMTPLKTPPFYANRVPAFGVVIPFGLHVDNNSQVCTDADEPIPGLFAIGNMQGDFLAYTYPVICPGLSVGRGLTYGQLVGAALAHGTVLTEEM